MTEEHIPTATAQETDRERERPPLPEPLPSPIIDNHSHLTYERGGEKMTPAQALDAAEAVGVAGIVHVGCDLETSQFGAELAREDPRVVAAVAIHPNEAPALAAAGSLGAALARIEHLAAGERVRALGETGLDYFRTGEDERPHQHESFRRHIDVAKRLNLALQIHDRDAHDDVVRILEEEGPPERVVFHCFSGESSLARRCNDTGWYMSFSGTVTFKNSNPLREALSLALPELLLAETDSPFLAPHPYRGRPNSSYLLPLVVRTMAEQRGADLDDLCHRIYTNTQTVYGPW